ncbi:MAG: ribosome maturation factor RimM [Syntrophobacterales bacterium]|jgi:16S rRNA processing protein RimM|nr:ribosome maturation factor RimM [Syntrophobacterales bacterium]
MEYISVGRALGTYGIKGEIRFRYYNEVKENFLRYSSLFHRKDDLYEELEVTGKRFQKGLFYIKFKGLESPEEVFPLVNKELFVREMDLPRLESHEYYDYQLVGLDVTDRKGDRIGKVKSIVHTKANDLLTVSVGDEELFIPLIEEVVLKIDLEGSSIIVDGSATVS